MFGFDSPTKQVYEDGAKEVALCVLGGINCNQNRPQYFDLICLCTNEFGLTHLVLQQAFSHMDKQAVGRHTQCVASLNLQWTTFFVTFKRFEQKPCGIDISLSLSVSYFFLHKYQTTTLLFHFLQHTERKFTLKFSAIEIYNEAVRDLLSGDNNQLRLLDDPEVHITCFSILCYTLYHILLDPTLISVLLLHQRGTVVEKLIEETIRDRTHLEELLTVCESE